jgi:hypothetical protein
MNLGFHQFITIPQNQNSKFILKLFIILGIDL